MNKTKLEVIRINEDVIATSGLCKYLYINKDINNNSNDHLYVNSVVNYQGQDIALYAGYSFGNPLLSFEPQGGYPVDYFENSNVKSNTWYHYDLNTSHYVECDEQSSISHPHN